MAGARFSSRADAYIASFQPLGRGIPISQLVLGEALDVAPRRVMPRRIFAGAAGEPRPDLANIDEQIRSSGLTEEQFACRLTRRMGWRGRGWLSSEAQLLLVRLRKGQPVLRSEYLGALDVLREPARWATP